MQNNYLQGLTGMTTVSSSLIRVSRKWVLALGILFCGSMLAKAQFTPTIYYLRTDSVRRGRQVKVPVNNLLAWTTDSTGAKGQTPTDFTTPFQIFRVQTNGFTNPGYWNLGPFNQVVIGAKDSTISFTSSANSQIAGAINVVRNSTFIYSGASTDSLSFNILDSASTVRYGGNATACQKVLAASYYNLSVSPQGTVLPVILSNDSTIKIAGTFTRGASTVVLNGSTIEFNGKGGQVIPGGAYYNLTISGTKTLSDSLRGNVNVAGTFTNSSTGSPLQVYTSTGISTVSYSGFIPQTINNQSFYNLSFVNGRSFAVSTFDSASSSITLFAKDPDLTIGQKAIPTALYYPLYLDSTTSIVNIQSDTVITLSKAPLLAVLINTAGHLPGAAPDTAYITSYSASTKTITLNNAPVFNVGDTLAGVLFPTIGGRLGGTTTVATINGNVVSFNGNMSANPILGSVTFGNVNGNPSNKTIFGNNYIYGFFNNGTGNITTTGSTINFNGKSQYIPGIVYNNLYLYQDSATTASLTSPALVQGNFGLFSGKLYTTVRTLLTLDSNATFISPSNDTFFVAGPMIKNFVSTKPFTYYIGQIVNGLGKGRNVTIAPKTSDAKSYAAYWTATTTPNYTNYDSTNLVSIDSTSYYIIKLTNSNGGDSSAKISFQYKYDAIIDTMNFALANSPLTKWWLAGSGPIPTQTSLGSAGTITTDSFTTNFGYFAFGYKKATPILTPIELLSFTGRNKNVGNELTWTTTGERDMSNFVVERSVSPYIGFSPIATIKAKGNNNSLLKYNYVVEDNNLANGTTYYYRIAEYSINGDKTYSPVVSIKANNITALRLNVYPNPVEDKLNLTVASPSTQKATILITDMFGRAVKMAQSQFISGQNSVLFDVSNFKTGNYNITTVTETGDKINTQFIKQ